jgi:hypothetical protein
VTLNLDGLKSGSVNIFNYNPAVATFDFSYVSSTAPIGGSMVTTLHDGATVTVHDYSSLMFG